MHLAVGDLGQMSVAITVSSFNFQKDPEAKSEHCSQP
jgi:hypothetical protein